MVRTVDLDNWVVILQQRDNAGLENLIQTMTKVALALDMKIHRPDM